MIEPGQIPQIEGDLEAVAAHGQTLKTRGNEFADTGLDVHTSWQGLTAFYRAPEAATLFTATVPVKTTAADVGADLATIGGALVTYADTARLLQAQLRALRIDAEVFQALVENDDDWDMNQNTVDEHNRLFAQTNTAFAAWEAAQRTCANTINALFGGIRYVPNNGDARQDPNEYGYIADQLDHAKDLPWGTPTERDKPGWEDAWDTWVSFDTGFSHDGAWGDVTGLGNLLHVGGGEKFRQGWKGIYELALLTDPATLASLAANQDPSMPFVRKGQLADDYKNMGKGFLAWDEWKKDPARAAGNVTWNVVSILVGAKGTTAALKIGRIGALTEKLTSVVGRVSTKVPDVAVTSVKVGGENLGELDTSIKTGADLPSGIHEPHVEAPHIDAAQVPAADTHLPTIEIPSPHDPIPVEHETPSASHQTADHPSGQHETTTHHDTAPEHHWHDSTGSDDTNASPSHDASAADPPDRGLIRRDDEFSDEVNKYGFRKSHLNANGDLVPANPHGNIEPIQHVLGHRASDAKSNSPFSSVSLEGTQNAKLFGGDEIRIDLNRLQHDVSTGRTREVELLPPDKLQESLRQAINDRAGKQIEVTIDWTASDRKLQEFVDSLDLSKTKAHRVYPRIRALLNSQRDEEWLIRGIVPGEYIEGPYPAAGR
jgi:hypothetical protein